MRVRFFTNKNEECDEIEKCLKESSVAYKAINIKTLRGKKIAKDWVVNNNRVPFLFFMSDDEAHTYYATNTKMDMNKETLKKLIKDITKKDEHSYFHKNAEVGEPELW